MTLPAGLYAHFNTSEGAFVARLFEEEAPKTVATFAGLADGSLEWQDPVSRQTIHRPFYDGLIFHRVIDGFVIQGGCPMGNGSSSTRARQDTDGEVTCSKPAAARLMRSHPSTSNRC